MCRAIGSRVSLLTPGEARLMKSLAVSLLLVSCTSLAQAQELTFPVGASIEDKSFATGIKSLARAVLANYRESERDTYLGNVFRLRVALDQYADGVITLDAWLAEHRSASSGEPRSRSLGVELYLRAKAREAADHVPFDDAFEREFKRAFITFGDREASDLEWALGTSPRAYENLLRQVLARHTSAPMTMQDALQLIRIYVSLEAYQSFAPRIDMLSSTEDNRRYIIQDDVLIHTKDGATLSAIVARPRTPVKLPAALFAGVETSPSYYLHNATVAASHGYVGVSADTHGKRLSPDEVVLFENDAKDLYGVIDWIARQPWSDGQVGMYGGSGAGFTQWAAAKSLHPALKTIVPCCPNNPAFGLPMNNNIFQTANYDYTFYVTNNKTTDPNFSGRDRAPPVLKRWFESGRPYRELDQVDGIPNKWLQRWLQHPSYDAYWQSMTPYRRDYARLNIPILAIDGYYDDGQNYAMFNIQEHYKYHPNAEHYLVIGPYDHFGTRTDPKPPLVNGYSIDPVAQFNTDELIFGWLDYVMRGGPKPAMLQDRINYEVMGANLWKHAPSIAAMSNRLLTLYLANVKAGDNYRLAMQKPSDPGSVIQIVDFADRKHMSFDPYPDEILTASLNRRSGLTFISDPLDKPLEVSGMFSADLKARLNKKDMDVVMALYEIMPDGRLFHLAYTVARASYAHDMRQRRLLRPGQVEDIPLNQTLLVSRQLSKGSRLLVVLDVQKSAAAQVNYGTGKDVSAESIADAKVPLQVQWRNDSVVTVPVWQ